MQVESPDTVHLSQLPNACISAMPMAASILSFHLLKQKPVQLKVSVQADPTVARNQQMSTCLKQQNLQHVALLGVHFDLTLWCLCHRVLSF